MKKTNGTRTTTNRINKTLIIFSALLFITSIILGLIFANVIEEKKASLATLTGFAIINGTSSESSKISINRCINANNVDVIIKGYFNLQKQIENLTNKSCITKEEKQKIFETINKIEILTNESS